MASAEWLLAHALGSTIRSTARSAIAEGRRLTPVEEARFQKFISRRSTREPTQYIVGKWGFHDIELEMRPPVLVPRPETEELVDLILTWWQQQKSDAPARFLDVGCGTGCLGLALLNHLPSGSFCRGIDINPTAVSLANSNAISVLRSRSNEYIAEMRQAGTLRPQGEQTYDFIVSNPPYIPSRDLELLEPEVVRFEDKAALDGGDDGLSVVRQLLDRAHSYLDPTSVRTIWLELDVSHPLTLSAELSSRRAWAASFGFNELKPELIQSHTDLSGNPRFAQLAFPSPSPSPSSSS
eukprot:CAMPEP_0197320900 /NCGR_PEP_ID=MMETSP0891-20130614/62212_1 /TAXON_ID=44058 ORGANISM="Aureoumbra lagunensis, Strain CCMP1510" /NCGR_SAMPLE_ID=MMETSP0891 /ASSEMBLY_ACC=CAM_ASM_000534 /LENGTH=294 /DNA_ID=CAMNT_0042812487 /DNA_START=24 /DNA_END=908 /DNA_ORIENTATION=+